MTTRLGATPLADGSCRFLVWAPRSASVSVHLDGAEERTEPLRNLGRGYHGGDVAGCPPGTDAMYRLDDGSEHPDPASRHQHHGVAGPSRVWDPDFAWTDDGWTGIPWTDTVLYEAHVGTWTPEGTFDAAVQHLPELVDLGVTTLELMPVAQFPGARNWGYDGVFPYAVQDSYGGPDGLRRLVDACHGHGLAVCLDVVYNHLGPGGNVLPRYGPYFTDHYHTPWGAAMNLDQAGSDEVRRYFIQNAVEWVTDFHIDALRLDAVHAIIDPTPRPFLRELTDAVHAAGRRLGRRVHVVAESDANDPRLVRSRPRGGDGMDAAWSDDLHHALHAVLTGERVGYYADHGSLEGLARGLRHGFVFTGQHSAYRGRRHGAPTAGVPTSRFVAFLQNHDQVGNRAAGERLASLTDADGLRLAAGIVLLGPFVPLMFMGEEHGETNPFLYFTDHADPTLRKAVREGRARECRGFGWSEPSPDPNDPETFARSRIEWAAREREPGRSLLAYHRHLLRLRREHPALGARDAPRPRTWTDEATGTLAVHRPAPRTAPGAPDALLVCTLGPATDAAVPVPPGDWRLLLDSADRAWGGAGATAPSTLRGADGGRVPLPRAGRSLAVHLGGAA